MRESSWIRSDCWLHRVLRALALLGIAAHLAACAPEPAGEFAIYLPANDMTVSEMAAADLQSVALQDVPVISTTDIVSYKWGTHEIRLTAMAFQRILDMRVPVSGTPFVACVARKPVYWGAFWTPISSQSFEGVTIMLPLGADNHTISIELGYPSPPFYKGEDPRFNAEVRKSLEQAAKLR